MDNGYIKSYRSIMDNPIVCKDADHYAVWGYLLHNATHSKIDMFFGCNRITLMPGQLITSRKKIANHFKIQESKVERILKTFKNEQQIEQLSTSTSRLISILNWQIYQSSEQQNEQQVNSDRTASEQQVNTNKKERKKECNNNDINTCPDNLQNSIIHEKPEKEKSSAKKENYDLSFVVPEYFPIINDWLLYKADKKQGYKNQQSVEACYRKLHGFSHGDPKDARLIIDDAMANNYSGFFELKIDKNGKANNSRASKEILGDPTKRTTTIPRPARNE